MRNIKIIAISLWGTLFVSLLVLWLRSEVLLTEIPELLNVWLSQWGFFNAAIIYIILYTLRPLILFPAALLTIASGLVFGPWYGVLFTIIGENCSANVGFIIARWFGRDWVKDHEQEKLRRWEKKLNENGLITVLIMRLIYLPFDAVNFGCGLTSIRQRDFALGTFIGIMPGLVSFVLIGGSIAAGVDNRLLVISISLVCFLIGLVVAHKVKKHHAPHTSVS